MKKSKKYKEIFKLKKMLEDVEIPFHFIVGFGYPEEALRALPDGFEHYQICYPSHGSDQWISVIEGFGTHGEEQDKLEIMGGFTPWERYEYGDSVIGYLTAKNVFNRIKKHYTKTIVKDIIEKWEELKDEKSS